MPRRRHRTAHEHCATQSRRLNVVATPIGANDLWIASHALAEGTTLVTNKLREFERGDGSRLDKWIA